LKYILKVIDPTLEYTEGQVYQYFLMQYLSPNFLYVYICLSLGQLVVLVKLSVLVQVIDWKDSSPK